MFTREEALALLRLPGALDSETALVKAWLRGHGGGYQGFDFNVRVGGNAYAFAGLDEPWRSQARALSSRLIDVVAYEGHSIDLLEVKGKADPCAIGQCRAYKRLWEREHPELPVKMLGVIVALLDDEMGYVLQMEGITYFTYPELVDVIRRT